MGEAVVQKVMVSSTVLELPKHREQVISACMRLRMLPIAMEHTAIRDSNAVQASKAMVEEADIYVGIFGYRYGHIPEGGEVSITEIEYQHALDLNIPIYVFLMHDQHAVVAADVETGPGATKLEALKDRLMADHVCAFFTSPADLRAHAIDALAQHRLGHRSGFHYVRDIPAPPRPYVAHPYTLLQTSRLVGRQKELGEITEWATSSGEGDASVYCVVAIGGMGKSALTWTWFDEVARHEVRPLAGRLWWSFYESDATFENFVIRTLAYVWARPHDEIAELPVMERENLLLEVLGNERYLIVLDGLERILNAYLRDESLHTAGPALDERTKNPTHVSGPPERHWLRKAADPRADSFLRRLCHGGRSRVLVSTRLVPAAFQTLTGTVREGVTTRDLGGLRVEDAVDLWRRLGVSGTTEQLSPFFTSFDSYPLIVRTLAGIIAHYRPAPGDFSAWLADHPDFNPYSLELVQRHTHVLQYALRGLRSDLRRVLSTLAAFRMPTNYERLLRLMVGKGRFYQAERHLDSALTALEDRGLVGWDRQANRYDLHPVVRGVSWHSLGRIGRRILHESLVRHFQDLPVHVKNDVKSIDDLTGAIELYNVCIGLERFDEAFELYRLHLVNEMTVRLNLTRQAAEALERLFPDGLSERPRLAVSANQDMASHYLAYALFYSGQPSKSLALEENRTEDSRSATDWHNLAVDIYTATGQVRAAEITCRRAYAVGALLCSAVFMASLARTRGQLAVSAQLVERCLAMFDRDECYDEHHLKALQLALGLRDFSPGDETERLLERARVVAEKADRQRCLVDLKWIEASATRRRCPQDGVEALIEALSAARLAQYTHTEIICGLDLADVLIDLGRLDDAADALEDVWDPIERGTYVVLEGRANLIRGRLYERSGRDDDALPCLRRAARIAYADGPPYSIVEMLEDASERLAALGAPLNLAPRETPAGPRLLDVSVAGVTVPGDADG